METIDLGRVVGITPSIKDDNWYIGDLDTGIKATGPQGPKGDTGSVPRGEPNGVASLDENTRVPREQLPFLIVGNGSTFEEAGEKGAIKISIKDNVAYIWTKQEE